MPEQLAITMRKSSSGLGENSNCFLFLFSILLFESSECKSATANTLNVVYH